MVNLSIHWNTENPSDKMSLASTASHAVSQIKGEHDVWALLAAWSRLNVGLRIWKRQNIVQAQVKGRCMTFEADMLAIARSLLANIPAFDDSASHFSEF
jgi:hypothetical protein